LVSCSTRAVTLTVSPIRVKLQFASAADNARDHRAGVDADADPKLATESLGDVTLGHGHGYSSWIDPANAHGG